MRRKKFDTHLPHVLNIVQRRHLPILKGLKSLSPGLRERATLGYWPTFHNPEGVEQYAFIEIQPLQGWSLFQRTQGRRCYANPGLSDHNPVGVAKNPLKYV